MTTRIDWTLPKLFMLVALRYAEGNPDKGAGVAMKVKSGQTAIARGLARHDLVTLGRASPPDHGTTVALTKTGRVVVDAILQALQRMGPA